MATKGKTVGVWLPGESVDALNKALEGQPNLKEGTYCAAAVQERLRSEGHLTDSPTGQLAARVLELAKVIGPEAVEAALDQIASTHLSAEPARS